MLRKFSENSHKKSFRPVFMRVAVVLCLFGVLGCSTPPKAKPKLVQERGTCPLAQDWPMFQADALRRGERPGDLTRPSLKWATRIGIQSWLNNPVIVGDVVVVGSSGRLWNESDDLDGVYGLDVKTGEKRWFVATDADANGVAVGHCLAVATSDDGLVRGIDARDGTVKWTAAFGTKVYTNPLVIGETVWVGDAMGRLTALDMTNGKTRWQVELGAPIRGGLAANGGTIFAATEAGAVRAFSMSGEPKWERTLKGVYSAPTVVGDLLVVAIIRDTTYPRPAIVALDVATGDMKWEGSNAKGLKGGWANIRASVAAPQGLLFWAEAYTNRVVAASAADGEIEWSVPSGPCYFRQWSSPVVLGDLVIVGRLDGGLHAHDVSSGTMHWVFSLARSKATGLNTDYEPWDTCTHAPVEGFPILATPAISRDGWLIVGTEEGYLYAVGPES